MNPNINLDFFSGQEENIADEMNKITEIDANSHDNLND